MPKPEKITVLLIEDSDVDARVIEKALDDAHDVDIQWHHVKRLDEGLELLSKNPVDVLLLDLNLPDSSGPQSAQTARTRFPHLPIVVLTGIDEREVGLESIHVGAQDYLLKKRLDSELLTRSLLYAIQRLQVEENNRELAAAREIQDRLSPAQSPTIAGFDIAGVCRPASVAGGDYFDYVQLMDGTWGILVADVSGNGLGAAMLMGEARASIRALARTNMSAQEILEAVHHILYDEAPEEKFITLFFLHLDPGQRSIRHVAAGHEAFFLRGGADLEVLRCTTLSLAMDEKIDCAESEPIALSTGDIIVLLTDGITESHGPDRELFGIERSLDVVRANATKSAAKIVKALHEDAHNFGGNHHDDDSTVVVVKVE